LFGGWRLIAPVFCYLQRSMLSHETGALPERINHRGHRNIEHLSDLSPAHIFCPEPQHLITPKHATLPAERLALGSD